MIILRKIYFRIFIVILSMRWIKRVNICDYVMYDKKEYLVSNGVRPNMWRLATLDNGDDGWVKRENCKKIYSLKNVIYSFMSGYRFYTLNWYDIWVREGIKPYMRSANIW